MRFASSFSSVLYFLAILYFSLCIQTLRCMLVIWSAEVYSEGLFPTQRGELSLVCSWRQQLAGSLSFHSPAALPFSGVFSSSHGSSCPKPANVLFTRATRRTRPETAHAHPSQMQPTTSSGRNRQPSHQRGSGRGKEAATVLTAAGPRLEPLLLQELLQTPLPPLQTPLPPHAGADGTCVNGGLSVPEAQLGAARRGRGVAWGCRGHGWSRDCTSRFAQEQHGH